MDAEMTQLDDRVKRQWRIEAGIVGGVLTILFVAAGGLAPWRPGAIVGLLVGALIAWALQSIVSIRYRYWRYGLAEDVLILERGVWTRKRSMTPYFRVQNVDITQGPLERWLGLKHLTIRTASAFTDASIPGLDSEDAESLRIRILERAGQDAAV